MGNGETGWTLDAGNDLTGVDPDLRSPWIRTRWFVADRREVSNDVLDLAAARLIPWLGTVE